MNVLIRVDASESIGIGHLQRCLAIGEHLLSNGSKVIFLSRSEYVGEVLGRRDFEARLLLTHSSLGEEVDVIRSIIEQEAIDVAIVDVNDTTTFPAEADYVRYLSDFKALPVGIVSFEDDKTHPSIADIVIIPYAGAEELGLLELEGCRYLLGPKYFILNQSLLAAKKVVVKDKIDGIVVTMGGSDTGNLTLTVLRALKATNLAVKLNVILGGLSSISDEAVHSVLKGFKGSYSVLRDVSNMGEVMSESDMAIINSGLTKYEAAYLGLPCLVVSINEHHSEVMQAFSRSGAAIHLGMARDVAEKDILEVVERLAADPQKRREMSAAGKSMVDGCGVERIASEILSLVDVRKTRSSCYGQV